MKQWIAEVAYDTSSGPKKTEESFFVPTEEDVRSEILKKGGYVLSIRAAERSPLERILARSSWWQIQLLRGIQFRSTATSPGVAFWRIIEAETNPRRQNILAPAREALTQGLSAIEALKALNIFDRGTLAILAASDKANKLQEGIPHAIHSITQKRKNNGALMGTIAWLGFDVFSIVQSLLWGRGFVLGYFAENAPTDPVEHEKYTHVVSNLSLLWNVLIATAFGMMAFMGWTIFSFVMNKGKKDWPTARVVRSIPLIGAYLRDLGFADSMVACARMIRGNVPIGDALKQAGEATNSPEVATYWENVRTELERGVMLGAALDREPLSRSERMELATLSDLTQIGTIMEAIAELREGAAKTKHKLIVWLAFLLTGVYLVIAFGSAIFGLSVMNMGMDSMMNELAGGAF